MSVELLAPAGSYEGLIMNLDCGADAVYLGGASFGARAYAKNLTQEELLQGIDDAHDRKKKLYLTVNTLLKNQELYGELYEYLSPYYEQGLDAVIVQDYGVMKFIKEEFPGLFIHASTQMAVTGSKGSKLLESYGACRVVTARELSLKEIRDIRDHTDLEIESFVHGALCYSYSGQCLFSSILGGRSGNRGRCAQPCRLPYQLYRGSEQLTRGKIQTPLSLKDMNTIELLPEIIKAGVTSLKIEGRMKQASYGAGVVHIYRKYLDLYQSDPNHYQVDPQDQRELLALFSRGGSCKGYYQMRNGKSMMDFYNDRKTGETKKEFPKKKEKLKGILRLIPEQPAILDLEYKGVCVSVTGDKVQPAIRQPLGEERIREQISKTGNLPYEFAELQVECEDGIFLPMKSLNQLRRDAFAELMENLRQPHRRTGKGQKLAKAVAEHEPKRLDPVFYASCETMEQAKILLGVPEIRRIYCSWDIAAAVLSMPHRQEIGMILPYVTRMEDLHSMKALVEQAQKLGCDLFLVRNLETAAWMGELGLGHQMILDSGMYTFNNESLAFWREQGVEQFSAPLELNSRELGQRENRDSEFVIYGYLPMMISAQCLQKNLDQCRKNYATLSLKDRYSKDFRVKCYCDFCYNVIYNSVPYGLMKESSLVNRLGFAALRLSFTLETGEEVRKITRDLLDSYQDLPVKGDYMLTKGHFKRGVE